MVSVCRFCARKAQKRHTKRGKVSLDLMMPIMDGAAFRQAQQADPRIAAIPVVVLSAAENIAAQAPLLTADAYVPKPIEFDNLLQVVEQYCQRSRAHGLQASM